MNLVKRAVAWCSGCEHYTDAVDAGDSCPAPECARTLRRRVGWVDLDSPEHEIFFGGKREADEFFRF